MVRPSKRGDFLTDLTHYSGFRVDTCSSPLYHVSLGRLDVYGYLPVGALSNKRYLALKWPRFGDPSFPSIRPDADICLMPASLHRFSMEKRVTWRISGQRGEEIMISACQHNTTLTTIPWTSMGKFRRPTTRSPLIESRNT